MYDLALAQRKYEIDCFVNEAINCLFCSEEILDIYCSSSSQP